MDRLKDMTGGMNRRELLLGASATAALRGRIAAHSSSNTTDKATGDFAVGSKVFALSAIAPTKASNGSQRMAAFHGTLATGEAVAAHESWTPAGLAPSPTHTIQHSEIILVLEGALTFVHDGREDPAVGGDVIYVAYGTNHAIRNTGKTTARYMVLQVGGDTR